MDSAFSCVCHTRRDTEREEKARMNWMFFSSFIHLLISSTSYNILFVNRTPNNIYQQTIPSTVDVCVCVIVHFFFLSHSLFRRSFDACHKNKYLWPNVSKIYGGIDDLSTQSVETQNSTHFQWNIYEYESCTQRQFWFFLRLIFVFFFCTNKNQDFLSIKMLFSMEQ